MTIDRAIRLAKKWAAGGVCTLSEDEAREYHEICLDALQAVDNPLVLSCKAGDTVWCIERDEDGDECDYYRYKFIATIGEYVIVGLASINGDTSLSGILKYAMNDMRAGLSTDVFSIFPIEDVYITAQEAELRLNY